MNSRHPTDDKRRAIEGILNPRSSAGRDFPDGYTPTGIGLTSTPRAERRNLSIAILVSAIIILFGAAATLMIIYRDDIAEMLAVNSIKEIDSAEGGSLTATERQEIETDLQAANAELALLKGLPEANANLQRQLAEKEQEITRLKGDIELLKSQADPDAESETKSLIERLQRERDEAIEERNKTTEKNRTLERQLLARNQEYAENVTSSQTIVAENNELRRSLSERELEVEDLNSKILRLEKDLDEVNTEYRRILKQLTDLRVSSNEKDVQIAELLDENKILRQQRMEQQAATTESSESVASRAISSDIDKPKPVHIERPTYPASAMRRKVGGIVQVRVLVGTSGQVLQAEVLSSPDPLGSLDREALRAAKRWRFEPARRNGIPVEVWYEIPMEFKPRS